MSGSVFNIPIKLRDPFFYSDDRVKIDESHMEPCEPFFAYEILYYNGRGADSLPWLVQGAWMKDILMEWKKEEDYLKGLFKSRSKGIVEWMRKSICRFYVLLYWSNKHPVNLNHWQSSIDHFSLKPVNVIERLTFIRNNPALYHSFIQLSQLFEEQHKQYAKYQALKSTNK
ncbi:YpoC family protein [Rossellomorea sp. LjRoot5]|uniref:YpoC family protein n=1 Tax=Rossellomorea sp. LjRoot5 TaxID=3342331 RepID=UPI003ECF9E04